MPTGRNKNAYQIDLNIEQFSGVRENNGAHFPPKRKLGWVLLGLGCAVSLLFLSNFTNVTTTTVNQAAIPIANASLRRENIQRKNFIKRMMRHAWKNYANFAWGDNELEPVSRSGFVGQAHLGGAKLGLTIIDSLDTLYLMGMQAELANATDWIKNHFNISKAVSAISVFEANIRLLGGFLSIHALTKKKIYLENAIDVANALLPAFNSFSKLPYSLVDVNSETGSLYHWSGGCVILSEVGTLHLEFAYLSEMTGNPVYLKKMKKIREIINQTQSASGLYPNQIDFYSDKGSRCRYGATVSVGALGDSFYEYLYKAWLLSAKTDLVAKNMFYKAVEALQNQLLQTSASGLRYFATMDVANRLSHEMEHLACFIGGLLAISARHSNDPAGFLKLAQDLTLTCRKSYSSTVTKLGPEKMIFNQDGNPTHRASDKHYLLRPEVVESYYYLWKVTGDMKYRDWAWDAAQAIERYCRVEHGYTGIRDVNESNVVSDDVQQSFFMAETLKYLFLIFLDSDPIPLDAWVFNTEAHPLPVIGSASFNQAFYAWRGIQFSPTLLPKD